ncbi:helix-turn-helix domain-containing protein [Streptomyces sp. NPDC058861]|uniref:helix-turn-helix domain-containing protein n=1 Tax=Streptomyces sp. NPDC058861 TaxID=3346653 RepID=UPI00368666CD
MGKSQLGQAGAPESAALRRLRVEIGAADRFITWVTWSCAAGMVLWSMLNATPYVRAHVAAGWESTAFVLPLVVDAAFVGALRADEIASRHGVRAGAWPVLLRLFTGASSVFLNIGGSWEKNDWTGVFQHLVAPGLLVLLAEAGPAWRRTLAAKLTAAEREEERAARERATRERRERQEDEDRAKRKEREDAVRAAEERRQEEERKRRQHWDDQQKAHELEEKREAARAQRALEARRLDLEETRLTAARPAPAAPVAPRHHVPAPVAPVAPAPQAAPEALPAPVAPRTPTPAPAGAVAAAQPVAPRVTARIDAPAESDGEEKAPAGPVQDWELPGLPAEVRPGVEPIMLTESQVHTRIQYGHSQGWSQRRVAAFAGRSPSTINKHMKALDAEK